MDLNKLKAPFKEEEVEWRLDQVGSKDGRVWGRCLAYVSARAIMDRLDEVCGPENWKPKYDFIAEKGVICSLSIKIFSDWITKEDGAEATDFEPFKGGISSALKRAGNVWGMGRYLYGVESGFIQVVDRTTDGARYGKTKEGVPFYWTPPQLPDWALPPKPVLPPKTSNGIIPEFVESGQQKEGYHFPSIAGKLAMKHKGDCSTEDLAAFVEAIDKKYEGKVIPPVTASAHAVAIDEILRREGALDQQTDQDLDQDSFEKFGVVKRG